MLTNVTSTNSLTLTKIGTGFQALTNKESYAGATTVNNGTLILSGTGSLYNVSTALTPTVTVSVGGTLVLDNSTTNVANRIGGTTYPFPNNGVNNTIGVTNSGTAATALTLAGGTLSITGANAGGFSESLGAFLASNAQGTIIITPGTTSGTNILTLATFTSNGGSGSLFINGTSLGGTPGANVANVIVTPGAVPSLSGTGVALVGNYATGTDGTNTGFLTYGANGFRVAALSEYAALAVQPVSPAQTGLTNVTTTTFRTTNNVAVSVR